MRAKRLAVSILLGLATGVVLHFALYRIGVPVRAFIYQAF